MRTLVLALALMLTLENGAALTRWDTVTLIYHYSAVYGVRADDMLRLAMCESRQQPYPRDGAAGEVGPFQLHPRGLWLSTPWRGLGFQAFRNPELNVRAAAWAVANGYASHWSCWPIRYHYAALPQG